MKTTNLLLMTPAVLCGCFTYSKFPTDRADPVLRKIGEAKILKMSVHTGKKPGQDAGLCPGKKGKLYATAEVQWPGAKPVTRTIGNDVDSLAPSSFEVRGPLVRGDQNAHLHPNADILKSVESGFQATVVYKPEAKWAFNETWRPEYSCYVGWFNDGGVGDFGQGGEHGSNGDIGQHGGHGTPGFQGGPGGNGGRVNALVTIMSTRWYPRLLAVWANDNFFLAPADRELVFGAAGGQGGTGGEGGTGGQGGDQPYESKEVFEDGEKVSRNVATGTPGNGGDGAQGGAGGRGGNGGIVDVTYDNRYPELSRLIATDVSGGAGGYGGAGGNGGYGGTTGADQDHGAQEGQPGQPANAGQDGMPGGQGRANVRGGNVASRFNGLRGVYALGAAPAGPAPAASSRPMPGASPTRPMPGGAGPIKPAPSASPVHPAPAPHPTKPTSNRKAPLLKRKR